MGNIMEQNKFTWPLINNNINQRDREVLADFCLNGERFTNGPKVKEFEGIWSKWLGTKHSVMVNSGASGNFISIAIVKELMGVGEVIVPPIGWVSDISSVVQLGMTPVFVDVKLDTLSISIENIEKAITPKTKAIVLVHALGFNAINERIVELAKEHDLILIEDCCEAHGAMFNGKRVGSIGDISIFSFYFGHHITTIEGGMVCTNNEVINDQAKMFRSHGLTREAHKTTKDYHKEKYPELNPLFTFAVAGFNMRSTELNAVLGIEQMKRIDDNVAIRKRNLRHWLSNLNQDKYHVYFNVEGNSNFALPLILTPTFKHKLPDVCNFLENEGIEYRLGTAGGGNQALQPYLEKFPFRIVGGMDNANYIHHNSLYIGNHTDLTKKQIINLCKKLENV